MNLLEVREDIKVAVKILKKEYRERERMQTQIKKVDEFDKLCDEMKRLEMSIDLLNSTVWLLRVDA